MTMTESLLRSLHVSSFPEKFPHYAWTAALSAHSDFAASRVYVCLGVNCNLYFWQNDRFFFVFFYVPLQQNGGGTDTEEESAHKVDPGEENSPATPAGIRTRNLLITSPAL